jgi:hypothetical protein
MFSFGVKTCLPILETPENFFVILIGSLQYKEENVLVFHALVDDTAYEKRSASLTNLAYRTKTSVM